jgi:hypothetical protein
VDKFQQVAYESTFAAVVLGNLQTSDFELVCLAVEEVDPPSLQAVRMSRGLCFLGIVGMDANGQFRSALEVPLPDSTTSLLAQAFSQLAAARFAPAPNSLLQPKGDSADWIERLHSLPDMREES